MRTRQTTYRNALDQSERGSGEEDVTTLGRSSKYGGRTRMNNIPTRRTSATRPLAPSALHLTFVMVCSRERQCSGQPLPRSASMRSGRGGNLCRRAAETCATAATRLTVDVEAKGEEWKSGRARGRHRRRTEPAPGSRKWGKQVKRGAERIAHWAEYSCSSEAAAGKCQPPERRGFRT